MTTKPDRLVESTPVVQDGGSRSLSLLLLSPRRRPRSLTSKDPNSQ